MLQLSPPTKESRPEIQDKTQELGNLDGVGLHVTKKLQKKSGVTNAPCKTRQTCCESIIPHFQG